jgi:hypothetical protein
MKRDLMDLEPGYRLIEKALLLGLVGFWCAVALGWL